MRVGDVMHPEVVMVDPDDSISEAAGILREHRISAVMVRGADGPAGILTERDYVDVVARGLDPSSIKVADLMSSDLVICHSDTEVGVAARMMAERHIRHLPVVDEGQLVGIISIRDTVGGHPALAQLEEERHRSVQARIADHITAFAGSMLFVYVHVVWFMLWIALGVEDFPYGLLTMIVSLEAIFLATFVMISQNRADQRRQVLADHQWELVQQEEIQNEELLRLSGRILELTKAIHELTVVTTGKHEYGEDR
jgi:CBS domain-containing protein